MGAPRPADDTDAIGGGRPSDVAEPATVEEVAAVLRSADGVAVVARGAGTKLGWGTPPRACDLVVDLRRLDRIVEHAAGDMVVRVQAGVPLRRLASALAEAGQQLAVDVPAYDDGTVLDGGTVGGAVAVGVAGPRRLRYGGPRDLLLGVTMVRADGAIAASGGKVVKNVAGYDLGKLLCGSYGTLGVVVEATLRLHPLPAAVGYVTVTVSDLAAAHERAWAIVDSQLVPSAVELDRPGVGDPVTVVARFDGTPGGVAARTAAAGKLIGGTVAAGTPGWFGRWPGSPVGTLVEVTFPPAALVEVGAAVDAAAPAAGLVVPPVRGSAGVATLLLGLPADAPPEPVGSFLSGLRDALAGYDGSAVVRHAPAGVHAAVDAWGPVDPAALALMRRVKDQFDPDHRLSPGRFVGRI